jgi:hypothetical protein
VTESTGIVATQSARAHQAESLIFSRRRTYLLATDSLRTESAGRVPRIERCRAGATAHTSGEGAPTTQLDAGARIALLGLSPGPAIREAHARLLDQSTTAR